VRAFYYLLLWADEGQALAQRGAWISGQIENPQNAMQEKGVS